MTRYINIKSIESGLLKEVVFSTARSSGSGGQNINKVETKVELRFSIAGSKILTEEEKKIILKKLKNKINSNEEIIITSQTDRTQLQNKQKAINKFLTLIDNTLKPIKKRVATKPTKASVQRRLKNKQKHSEKKYFRQKNFI